MFNTVKVNQWNITLVYLKKINFSSGHKKVISKCAESANSIKKCRKYLESRLKKCNIVLKGTQKFKAPKHQNKDKHSALDDAMVLRIIEKIKEQPDISQEALGESIGVTRRVVQKYINALKESGRIERVGGKRYGHWEIKE